MNAVYPRAISLVERRLVDVESLVTHRHALAEVGEVFKVAAALAGRKVVIGTRLTFAL